MRSPNVSPGNTNYYVDADQGNDGGSGTSPATAWRTISRVNRSAFAPGDQLLFAAGQKFAGKLCFEKNSSGTAGKVITISSFGTGRAVIDAGASDGFVLTDCAHITIKDLNVIGCGRSNGSNGTGVHLVRTRHVQVDRVDVSGFRLDGVGTSGDQDTRLTHIYAHDNGSAGISIHGGSNGMPRSQRLYIGDCRAENNPGDPRNLTNHSGNGIVVGSVDEALIEYCAASNNGWDMPRTGNGPVGIWAWNADRVTIQHCISHGNRSPGADGGGFDFDGGVTNSVMQYNLSYGNEGTGYLLCQYPGASRWRDNVIRFNISVGDGIKNLHSGIGLWIGGAGISDALIYNNTIINPRHAVATLGPLAGFLYRNNIFVAGGDLLSGDFHLSRFENNLYWSTGKESAICRDGDSVYPTIVAWAGASGQELIDGKVAGIIVNPALLLPGSTAHLPTEPRKLASMSFYRLRRGSPCAGAGMVIPGNGRRDLFGNIVAARAPLSMGAHQPAGM